MLFNFKTLEVITLSKWWFKGTHCVTYGFNNDANKPTSCQYALLSVKSEITAENHVNRRQGFPVHKVHKAQSGNEYMELNGTQAQG